MRSLTPLNPCPMCGNFILDFLHEEIEITYMENRRYRFYCPICGQYFEYNAPSQMAAETIYNNVIAKQSATVVSSEDDFYHFCDNCNNEVYKKDKYCHTCGRELKWRKQC